MNAANISVILSQMTLEEKAMLCSTLDHALTKPIPRLNIPSIRMQDGPNGLRREDESIPITAAGYISVPAVCFPGSCALAASWNTEIMYQVGQLLGQACHAEKLPVLLGPGINIKRTPVCGRNFEYYSEDPYLAGKMAAAYINGLQSQNIGAGLKHFAANNQEFRRQSINAVIDERTLREIYLTAFEIAVTESQPWIIMCAFNRLNTEYCSENKYLLHDILRDEWGFKGFVVSDWLAVHDRVKALKAGLDLELPYNGPVNDQKIMYAVREGSLPLNILDRAVERMLTIIFKTAENEQPHAGYDAKAHHREVRKIAADCMVLLKNDEQILPLSPNVQLAVIGAFAEEPCFQGWGSAHVNATQVDIPLEEIRVFAPDVRFAQGYTLTGSGEDPALLAEAVALASSSDVVVVFAGLPEGIETEGLDRHNMNIPHGQNRLIEEISKVNPHVAVIVMAGSPVEMPWADSVKAVLFAYLAGQAAGGAVADLLFGKVNPSGKLPETFPLKLEHNPSYIHYGAPDDSEYREGVFVGYRYYDTKQLPVRFPFGHGLSYTRFEYSSLQTDKAVMFDDEDLTVSLTVNNAGSLAGSEVIQVYVHDGHSRVKRPQKELKGFCKVFLQPGEEKTVNFTLGKRAFAYYHTGINNWYVESGSYEIAAGSSSDDIRVRTTVDITNPYPYRLPITADTTVFDVIADPQCKILLEEMLEKWSPDYYNSVTKNIKTTECSTVEFFYANFVDSTLGILQLPLAGEDSEKIRMEYITRMNTIKR